MNESYEIMLLKKILDSKRGKPGFEKEIEYLIHVILYLESKNKKYEEFGHDYWIKFRDSIYEVGKPNFSIVSNNEDEHPDKNVIRISDCKFNVFIDISCGLDRLDAFERAQALCNVLNADYPFMK